MTNQSNPRAKAIEALESLTLPDNRPDIRLSAARTILDFVPEDSNDVNARLEEMAVAWEEGRNAGLGATPSTDNPYFSE